MKLSVGEIVLSLDESTLRYQVEAAGIEWKWSDHFYPAILTEKGEIPFTQWKEIRHTEFSCGVGKGIHSTYRNYLGKADSYSFDTIVWVEEVNKTVHFEWIPICEKDLSIQQVRWPGYMEFEEGSKENYTLLNQGQGLLIPNNWAVALEKLSFNGQFLTSGGYMPWFGQVKHGAGYIAIASTPWNGGVYAEHPAGGPYTHVGTWWEPSLGKMDYRRCLEYTFLNNCDYNDLCKVYRNYVKEHGLFTSLEEKAARVPSVNDLIGCSFVHCGIKTNVNPKSDFYDPENPEKNNFITTFAAREKEVENLYQLGVRKMYLHLDGWAEPGYDNHHPDYLPACIEAGGWEGMKSLVDTMHRLGFMFGIHDQYRDYYLDAPTFDPAYATMLPDGTYPQHARWAGGPQTYLCGTQAPYYVRRNFTEILSHGIKLDGTYLDVFTCNEGDECANPLHRMTRKECYEFRKNCFDWLLSKGILSSSEEVSDWSMQSLVFCHYAPYHFMLQAPGTPKDGIPVPLFNLVYHDCVIEPWMMDKLSDTEDLMLYALLNGGAPYLIRDGAYANTDGSFSEGAALEMKENIRRCEVVASLHEKVAKCEMVKHELIDDTGMKQRTTFSDGTTVTVDFAANHYEIC